MARRIERDLTPGFAIGIGACISRVGQDMIDRGVARVDPLDRRTVVGLHREGQAVGAERQPDATDRAELREACEDHADRPCDRFIGMEAYLAVLVAPDEPHGKTAPQLAAGSFVANAAEQASAQDMQLGLAHGALQPEQQPVVEHRRVIDAVGIADEGVGETAEIEQAVPVGVVPGQS